MDTCVRVVIVTFNNAPDILECLESILSQKSVRPEVVVVDNASTDSTVELIRSKFPEVKVIQNKENMGFGHACNEGIEGLTSDYVAFVNPDTLSDPSFLSCAISELISVPLAGACQARMMLYDCRERVNSHGNEANILLFSWPNGYMELVPPNDMPRKIPYASGCAAVYTRICLEGIGGFDDLFFMYFEDVELGLRAQLAGYDSRYSPSSVVYHKYRFKESPQRYFLLERNRILTMLIVFRKRTILAISPLAIAVELGVLAEAFFGGWYVEKIAAYGSLLRHAGHVLRKRRIVRDLRVRHDKELVQSLRGGVTFFPLRESAIVGIANRLFEKYRVFLLNMDI